MARAYEDTTRVGPFVDGRTCGDGEPRHELQHIEILTYRGNYSAFNGYRFTPSDYSAVSCTRCGAVWRTNAGWVELLPRRGTLVQQHATYDRMIDERLSARDAAGDPSS